MRKWGNLEIREWGNGEVTFWNINFAKISNFGKVHTAKAMCQDCQEGSEGNGEFWKGVEKSFDEKRVLDGWGQLIESLQEAYTNLGRLVQKGCISS